MADEKIPTIDVSGDELNETDMDILNSNSETAEEVETEEKEPETKEDEETETGEEESEEVEETTEEELPETKLRPSIKTMVKDFPELDKIFKKYPQIRDAYFREGKFSQMFPTLDDAQEANDKAESLDIFNEHLINGSSKELLEAIGKDNPDSLKKLATNFLPTLAKISDDLFYETTIPVVNTVIRNLYFSGEKSKDNNMMSAAKILAHYLHGSYEIPSADAKKADPEIEAERKKLNEEKETAEKEKYNEFNNTLNDRTKRLLTKVISDGLDPGDTLSEFTKSKIVDEVIERVGTELSSDRQHMTNITKLWKSARNERFNNKSADRILTAFLSRAKQLIPEIRSKVKNEALGKSRSNGNGISKTTNRDTNTGTRRSTSNSRTPDIKNVNKDFWRKNSDKDILG